MLRAAVERFGAHVAVGAGAAGAAAAAAVPTARCAKDEAKTVAPSFDPEALERGAKALLSSAPGGGLFPLRHQVDVAVSQMAWPPGSRFAIHPEAVLLTSPKSEEGKCDTDIQTLGKPSEMAHAQLPRNMLRL